MDKKEEESKECEYEKSESSSGSGNPFGAAVGDLGADVGAADHVVADAADVTRRSENDDEDYYEQIEVINADFDEILETVKSPNKLRNSSICTNTIGPLGIIASAEKLNEPRVYANRLLGKKVNTTNKIVMKNRNG